MKNNIYTYWRVAAIAVALNAVGGLSAADTVKAAWFVRDISCKVGTPLAGYGPDDISVAKLDDLQLHGLALDDGRNKILLMSFDLLGMDADLIRRMRSACASVLGVDDRNVLLTCTTRMAARTPDATRRKRNTVSNQNLSQRPKTSTANTSRFSNRRPWMP